MSSDAKYSPLSPVYKAPSALNDEEIALEELPVAPKDGCEKKDESCCEKKQWCKDGKKATIGTLTSVLQQLLLAF